MLSGIGMQLKKKELEYNFLYTYGIKFKTFSFSVQCKSGGLYLTDRMLF